MTRFHLLGIAGTGMGAFAGLLKQAGHEVRGTDQNVYPPMSDKLRDWEIEVRTPYAPEHLDPEVDLYVVGNVIRKTNEEAAALRARGLRYASFPETLGRMFLAERHSVVVAGTHGKTTTSTLLAHALVHAGRDPGYLVGGVPQGLDGNSESFRVGARGAPFVVEGDEYDTAYFDKGPKFLHYRARSLLATSLEFDHADIYDDVGQIESRFRQLFALMPEGSHTVVHAGSPILMRALEDARTASRVETYGPGGTWTHGPIEEDERGMRFEVSREGEAPRHLELPLSGDHNAMNALGAYAILRGLGLDHEDIAAGFASFQGIKRRMEVRGEADGVTVVDDFAHHPTAVATTVAGARRRYAGRPVWALFEPRSATSCRAIFQDDYARAFGGADRVLLAPPGRELPPGEALDTKKLADDLRAQGLEADARSIDEMVDAGAEAPSGAVLLCMSNGAFGGIHERLLERLRARRDARSKA
jgi:UDP-N-acetylmuramate: L-alanyl-gamma-D-glutamyl-meso-diaminopimelate ligase